MTSAKQERSLTMARMRRAHFKIEGAGIRLNGAHRGRLTIEDAAGRQLVRVRPLRQREYVLPLGTVAEMVIWRVARNELATEGARVRRDRARRWGSGRNS
jgi:hypothetical protein